MDRNQCGKHQRNDANLEYEIWDWGIKREIWNVLQMWNSKDYGN